MTNAKVKSEIRAVIGRAGGIAGARVEVLACIGEALEWDAAEYWIAEGADLLCVAEWDAEGRPEPVGATLSFGSGLPGRAWTSGHPVWVTDARSERRLFPRWAMAVERGMFSACAFPVHADGQVCGVMLFMARRRRRPALEVLEAMKGAVQAVEESIAQPQPSIVERSLPIERGGSAAPVKGGAAVPPLSGR
jgi:hypothetical protein